MKTRFSPSTGCNSPATRASRTRSSHRRAAGFTLIEVVVALAIFVIGALAIVRIFPPALGVIQNAGDRTTAANLSRGVLTLGRTDPLVVPDAVSDVTDAGDWNDFQGTMIGTVNQGNSLPRNRDEAAVASSALGHFRRIIGERQTVLSDGNNKFILTRHPYVNTATNFVKVFVEDRVTGVKVDSNGYLDFRDARRVSDNSPFFDVDPATPLPGGDPRRPPSNMRGENAVTYYVSYRWKQNDAGGVPRMQGVVGEPLYFRKNDISFAPVPTGGAPTPATAEQVFQGRATSGNPSGYDIIAGNVDVRFTRRLTIQPAAPLVPNADYRGFYDLNGTTEVNAGQKVMVNYTVKDWRWMVDETAPSQSPVADTSTGFTAPPATSRTRTLPIRYFNNEGTIPSTVSEPVGDPNFVYTLLTDTPDVGVTRFGEQPVGGTLTPWAGAWNSSSTAAPASNTRLLNVNAKQSQLSFGLENPSGSQRPMTAPRARSVYWALDGWALQTTVAARSYIPFSANRVNEREVWREYFWSGPGAGSAHSLYFHWGDAGKTVSITFQYLELGVVKTTPGTFTIDDTPLERASTVAPLGFAPGDGTTNKVVALELAKPDGTILADSDVVSILSVEGLSVRARTAWLDNGRYTQASVAGYRP